jgi:hypothetical protein
MRRARPTAEGLTLALNGDHGGGHDDGTGRGGLRVDNGEGGVPARGGEGGARGEWQQRLQGRRRVRGWTGSHSKLSFSALSYTSKHLGLQSLQLLLWLFGLFDVE